jgi:hypothetical protein
MSTAAAELIAHDMQVLRYLHKQQVAGESSYTKCHVAKNDAVRSGRPFIVQSELFVAPNPRRWFLGSWMRHCVSQLSNVH